MRKLHALAACAGLTLLFACTCIQEPCSVLNRTQLTESVVVLEDSVTHTLGLGVVISHDDEASYVATAWHVAFDISYKPVPLPEDIPESVGKISGLLGVGPKQEVVSPRTLEFQCDTSIHMLEVVKGARPFDAALLRVTPKLDLPAAEFADELVLDEPVVLVAQFPSIELLLLYEGTYQGVSGRTLVVSAHAHPGCSGGPAFVKRGDRWVIIGLTSGIGAVNNVPLHHITFLIPGDWLHQWIEEE